MYCDTRVILPSVKNDVHSSHSSVKNDVHFCAVLQWCNSARDQDVHRHTSAHFACKRNAALIVGLLFDVNAAFTDCILNWSLWQAVMFPRTRADSPVLVCSSSLFIIDQMPQLGRGQIASCLCMAFSFDIFSPGRAARPQALSLAPSWNQRLSLLAIKQCRK